MKNRCLIAALLCALTTGAAADVYQWVDKSGRVHFGDQPPGSRTHPIKPYADKRPADGEQQRRLDKTRRLLDAYRSERQQRREAEQREAQRLAQRQRNCAQSRDRLRQYRNAARVYELDRDGNRVYRPEAERQALIAEYQRSVKRWCAASGP